MELSGIIASLRHRNKMHFQPFISTTVFLRRHGMSARVPCTNHSTKPCQNTPCSARASTVSSLRSIVQSRSIRHIHATCPSTLRCIFSEYMHIYIIILPHKSILIIPMSRSLLWQRLRSLQSAVLFGDMPILMPRSCPLGKGSDLPRR